MSEDREWTLNNVEEVRVNTKDIDEICFGLEQLTIFATETIQNFATDILKLHQENQQLSNELRIKNEELRIKGKVLDEIREYVKEKAKEDEECTDIRFINFGEGVDYDLLKILDKVNK